MKFKGMNFVIDAIASRATMFILFFIFYKAFGFELAIIYGLANIATSVSRLEYRGRK